MVVAEKKYSYDDNSYLNEHLKSRTERVKKNNKKNKKKKRNLLMKISAIFCVVLISAALIFILLRYTEITEAEYKVHSLNKEIEQLENNLQDVKVSYDTLTRSDIIEKAALKELNMQYPKYEQMVFLDINNEKNLDLTVLEEKTSADEENIEQQNKDKNLSGYLKTTIKKIYSLLD